MDDGKPINPPRGRQARERLWRSWDKWTVKRAAAAAAFSAVAIAVTAWQLTMSSPVLGSCLFCTSSAADAQAASVHDFWAVGSIALIPLLVGVLRGRWWWVALGVVAIVAAAYWAFVVPVDPSDFPERCTVQTCPDFSPRPDDITFSPR